MGTVTRNCLHHIHGVGPYVLQLMKELGLSLVEEVIDECVIPIVEQIFHAEIMQMGYDEAEIYDLTVEKTEAWMQLNVCPPMWQAIAFAWRNFY